MTKILFLSANPSDTTRLRLDAEIRAIDEKLRRTEFRDKFEVVQQWAVRVSDLQDHLLRHKPDIVHFSGHGSTSSEIILEDDAGNSHPVSIKALSQLFSILRSDIRCVVLNACYSELQARTIAENIEYVVGMSKAIKDSAAISFAAAFYQALGYGKDYKTAFNLGCAQIALENLDEPDTPKLVAFTNNRKTEPKIVKQGSEPCGLTVANIAIEPANTYWTETSKSIFLTEYPYDRECTQCFHRTKFAPDATPSFDITILNDSNNHLLLTAVGIEVVSAAYSFRDTVENTYGAPLAEKVRKADMYTIKMPTIKIPTIEMPDIRSRLLRLRSSNLPELIAEGRYWDRLLSFDLQKLISIRLPDPVYLEPKAPYRYGLLLDKFCMHMPARAIIRMWALTNHGEAKSHEIGMIM